MYGTVARIKVIPGKLDELRAMAESNPSPAQEQGGAFFVYQMDDDPNELFLVVVAPSREAYRASSEDPAQSERFAQMSQYFAAEPQWHDGEIIDHVINL